MAWKIFKLLPRYANFKKFKIQTYANLKATKPTLASCSTKPSLARLLVRIGITRIRVATGTTGSKSHVEKSWEWQWTSDHLF